MDQVLHLENMIPRGLSQYLQTAREKLKESAEGFNEYSEYSPDVPKGKTLGLHNLEEYEEYEALGMQEMGSAVFVLMAGGMGERLGYKGIKPSITLETITGQSFLQYYINYIKAFERDTNSQIPLVLMVSADTDQLTCDYLEANHNFGLKNIHIVRQEKYPAMVNN